jgi:uncharacterized membrane protein
VPVSAGAIAATLIVIVAGYFVHRPLARVPENTLKFTVGVMLLAFGVFWTAEGLGFEWPGGDLAIIGLGAVILAGALSAVAILRKPPDAAR